MTCQHTQCNETCSTMMLLKIIIKEKDVNRCKMLQVMKLAESYTKIQKKWNKCCWNQVEAWQWNHQRKIVSARLFCAVWTIFRLSLHLWMCLEGHAKKWHTRDGIVNEFVFSTMFRMHRRVDMITNVSKRQNIQTCLLLCLTHTL